LIKDWPIPERLVELMDLDDKRGDVDADDENVIDVDEDSPDDDSDDDAIDVLVGDAAETSLSSRTYTPSLAWGRFHETISAKVYR
jgi:hypothetical protein